MVALLKMTEIRPKRFVIEETELLYLIIELVERIVLELVTEPCSDVAFLVCP